MPHYGGQPNVATFMCVHTQVCIYVCVYIGHTQVHTRVCACIHAWVCMCVQKSWQHPEDESGEREATCSVTGPCGVPVSAFELQIL